MKSKKIFRILTVILLLSTLFLIGCGKKKSEPQPEGPSISGDDDAKLSQLLGQTIDMSDLGGYSATSDSIPVSIFDMIKTKIDNRGVFLTNAYVCASGTCYIKTTYNSTLTSSQIDVITSKLNGIMLEIGYSGSLSQVYLGSTYAYYVNRTGTLTFNNSDNTMSYSSVSADSIFKSANFTGLPKETAMASQTANGTYSLVENTLNNGSKENMLNWIGSTDADQTLLPNTIFKVLIIQGKDILMTYPFVREDANPQPSSIAIAQAQAGGAPTDIASAKTALEHKWNYLNVGSIEFKTDGTWEYTVLGAINYSGTWDIIKIGDTYYLQLLYDQSLVEGTLKPFSPNKRWVIVEYYADDNYFAMNIYRKKTNLGIDTLAGIWEHSNYDYMDNYWSYSTYPLTLTDTQLQDYQSQIDAKNQDDKNFLDTCYVKTGDQMVKKTVKGIKSRTYFQVPKNNQRSILEKILP